MPIVGTSYPHEVPTIDEFCRRTVTDGDQPFVGCKSTFEYPSSRLSNRAYASGASASGSSFDTTKLGVARPATIMSRNRSEERRVGKECGWRRAPDRWCGGADGAAERWRRRLVT